MFNKIIELSKSLRFWQLLIASVLVILGQEGVLTPEIANVLAGLFTANAGLRTIDKFSKK